MTSRFDTAFEPPAVWLAGDRRLAPALEALATAGALPVTLVAFGGSRRRDHGRLVVPGGEALFVKRFPEAASRRPRLEGLLRRLGASTAWREWRALSRAHASGAPVPEPRGLWRTRDGDLVLATGFLDGRPLAAALACGAKERRALLAEVAGMLRRFHAIGLVHRDLHAGNVRVTDSGPVLVDLTAARPARSVSARNRDWGELEHSLERILSTPDRVRLRAAALGTARPFTAPARAGLRTLGRATARRRRAHMASRTRRAASAGRRFAPIARDGWTGLRVRTLSDDDVATALRASETVAEVLKSDDRSRVRAVEVAGRRVIVKALAARGWLRVLADAVRGSSGRRAWIGGHGLAARGLGVATPLAFVERRVLGLPLASAVLLEDLRPAPPADVSDAPATEKADALARLLIDLHRAGVRHGDLKASHVVLASGAEGLEAKLIDLDGVRFPRRLGDRARVQALVELNASLPDSFPNALREVVFRRYAAALPFRAPTARVRADVVRRSLERRHRWSGADQAGVMVAQRK